MRSTAAVGGSAKMSQEYKRPFGTNGSTLKQMKVLYNQGIGCSVLYTTTLDMLGWPVPLRKPQDQGGLIRSD